MRPPVEGPLAQAITLERQGRLDDAFALAEAATQRDPGDAWGWLIRGVVHARRGERVSALESFRAAGRHARGWLTAEHLERAMGGGDLSAPLHGEVVQLFDSYAPRFDAHLTDQLDYRGHEAVPAMLGEALGGQRVGRAVDLGCGTGLCGPGLRPLCEVLIGVDLSPGMLVEASRSGRYDALWIADAVYALATLPGASVGALAAADCFGYVGPLAALLGEVRRVLTPTGALVFSVETGSTAPFAMNERRRVVFSTDYLRDAIADADLVLRAMTQGGLRREDGRDVPGAVLWVGRAAPP